MHIFLSHHISIQGSKSTTYLHQPCSPACLLARVRMAKRIHRYVSEPTASWYGISREGVTTTATTITILWYETVTLNQAVKCEMVQLTRYCVGGKMLTGRISKKRR